jgi:hypothetical protein
MPSPDDGSLLRAADIFGRSFSRTAPIGSTNRPGRIPGGTTIDFWRFLGFCGKIIITSCQR